MVTQKEWLTCDNPVKMLAFLESAGLRPNSRKTSLFGCACVRQAWHLLDDKRSRAAVEATERRADLLIGEDELAAASSAAWEAWIDSDLKSKFPLSESVRWSAWAIMHSIQPISTWNIIAGDIQANLLRDIVGNPLWSVHLTNGKWIGTCPDVLNIASVIYSERRFWDLPVLADALVDAGCDDIIILEHLRGPGPHALGCWALDFVLGKE